MPDEKTGIPYMIRPCEARDLDAARGICEETSSIELKTEQDRRFLLLTFCDAYVRYADCCFVAADENDRAVGYIFCASDTRRFFKDFRKHILPEIASLGPKYAVMGRGVCVAQSLCAVFAPAHLHIDLTAAARGQGVGTALVKTLKAELKARGIAKVGLTVSRKNVNAVRFYERNGFKILLHAFGENLMRADTEE